MKVVLIYRQQKAGIYSLEELFHTIADELKKNVELVEYEVGSRWNILTDVWRLRKMHADIYHVTGDILYITPLLPRRKTVLTIPDIIHYLYDLRGIKRLVYKWLWLLWPLRAAHAVTAISGQTRDDIVNHLAIDNARIHIIECCYGRLFKPRPFRPISDAPIILQIGTRANKNVPRLVEALKGLKCRLVLIGPIDADLHQYLVECCIDYTNRTNLTQEEIVLQYADCDIVSFVSISEGFGVPIIEAQASGRPVITSDVSPMREIAGEGACLVDPLDALAIRDGILKIVSSSDYRMQMVEHGLKNVVRYSPETIGLQYLELYRQVV